MDYNRLQRKNIWPRSKIYRYYSSRRITNYSFQLRERN